MASTWLRAPAGATKTIPAQWSAGARGTADQTLYRMSLIAADSRIQHAW